MKTYLLAALSAFLIVWILGPMVIPLLRRMKFGQIERELGPPSHKKKQGTPTMGGIMMLVAVVTVSLVFGLESVEFLMPTLLVTAAFALLGFLDDFIKIKRKRNLGLRAWQKTVVQIAVGLIVAFWAYKSPLIGPALYLPFSGAEWNIGLYYIPLVVFIVVAEVNAANLLDGLDGLATSVMLVYSLAMAVIFSVLAGTARQDGQMLLGINLGGMGVFSAGVVGACIGFLCYNAFPARVIMGDTGSLALGGMVSMMAITSRSAILLPVMGFCFLGSALSVILQVASNKLNHGKRMFKMAPIHHHFEIKGHPEAHIVTMYAIVTAVLCAVCLLSYLW